MSDDEADADGARAALSHEFIRYGRVQHTLRIGMADLLPAGLDPAAAQLLAWLVKQGPSRQGELAAYTFLDPSTVSRRISQLVQQGLVERRSDSVDGRAVQLYPTESGTAFFDRIAQWRMRIMGAVLADWEDDDVARLEQLLRRFNDDFETSRYDLIAPPGPPAPANAATAGLSTVDPVPMKQRER